MICFFNFKGCRKRIAKPAKGLAKEYAATLVRSNQPSSKNPIHWRGQRMRVR